LADEVQLGALFGKSGALTPVLSSASQSKEFAQFERIVKEFSRQPLTILGKESIVAAGFGIAGPSSMAPCAPPISRGSSTPKTLIKELDVPHVVLLNDSAPPATASSIFRRRFLRSETPALPNLAELALCSPPELVWASHFCVGTAAATRVVPSERWPLRFRSAHRAAN